MNPDPPVTKASARSLTPRSLARVALHNCDEPLCRGPSHTTQRGIRTVRARRGCARDWGVDPGRYLVPAQDLPQLRESSNNNSLNRPRPPSTAGAILCGAQGAVSAGEQASATSEQTLRAITPRDLADSRPRARFVACRTAIRNDSWRRCCQRRPREQSARALPPLRTQSEEALLDLYARDRSPAVREELVRRFMPLARSLALRYRRQTESLDDLVQVAGLGLVKAIDGFDPGRERGVRRLRGADDPRRAAPPLPRPRLEPAAAARAAGGDDEGRRARPAG